MRREPAAKSPFYAANFVGGAKVTVGAEDNDAIALTIQLTDANYQAIAARGHVFAYFSDDANGDALAVTPPDSVAIGAAGVILKELTTRTVYLLGSNASGVINLTVGENGADTWYLVILLPDGSRIVSGPITFA